MSTIELESRSRPISRKEASHDHETIDHLASVSAVALAVLCPASGEGGDDAITTSVADAWQPDHCGDQQRRSRPTLGRRSTPGSPSNFHDTATEFTQLGIHRKEKQVNKTNGATAATAAANEPSTGEPGQDDPTEHSWVFCG